MGCRLSAVLAELEPRLSGLAAGPEQGHVRRLAAGLPGSWSWACLELRLAAGEPQVDFSLCASRDRDGPPLAAALARGERWPALDGLLPLLDEWLRPGTILHRGVPGLWLEVDLPAGRAQPPFVFLTFADRGPAPDDLRDLIGRALGLLARPNESSWPAAAERFARALPPGGRVLHAGLPPAWRGIDAPRLNVLLPDAGAARRWLARIGWDSAGPQWELAFDLFGGPDGPLQVSLNAGEDISSLALETLSTTLRWPDLIGRLVARGLSDEAKGSALLEWTGSESLWRSGWDWRIRIDRQLGIKVAVDRELRGEVKAYLEFHARHAFA